MYNLDKQFFVLFGMVDPIVHFVHLVFFSFGIWKLGIYTSFPTSYPTFIYHVKYSHTEVLKIVYPNVLVLIFGKFVKIVGWSSCYA